MSNHQQYPQQPMSEQPAPYAPPAKKKRRWVPFFAYPAVLVLGVILGSSGGGSSTAPSASKPGPTTTVTAKATPDVPVAAETTEPPPPADVKPTKANFKLTVKVLGKQCFGSAGCNVTYRILIDYTGPDLDPSKTYEVVYEVRGGDDGTSTNSFTVTGGESSVDSEETASTKNKSAKLTAVVTDVL
jgi:hypothetical protein